MSVKNDPYTTRLHWAQRSCGLGIVVILAMLFFWPSPDVLAVTTLGDVVEPTQAADRFRMPDQELTTEDQSIKKAYYISLDEHGKKVGLSADQVNLMDMRMRQIELVNPLAEFNVSEDEKMNVLSNTGQFDRENDTLLLQGGVTFENTSGYILETEKAEINFANSSANTDEPVSGLGPAGSMSAQGGMRIEKAGALIILKGPSKVIINSNN